MTAYKDVIRDFAERTRENLLRVREITEQQVDLPDDERTAFEVTQLINSMLGLLVFPQQQYFDTIPETPIDDLLADGWPAIEVESVDPEWAKPPEHLHDLMRYLRNGIAHFNVEFTERRGILTGMRIWNKNKKGRTTWKAQISLEELELITDKFTKMLLEEGKVGSSHE